MIWLLHFIICDKVCFAFKVLTTELANLFSYFASVIDAKIITDESFYLLLIDLIENETRPVSFELIM